jgi:hypothetical protein
MVRPRISETLTPAGLGNSERTAGRGKSNRFGSALECQATHWSAASIFLKRTAQCLYDGWRECGSKAGKVSWLADA